MATWYRWPTAARLASALVACGADVCVVCPDLHPILTVRGLSRRYRFRYATPARSLTNGIERSDPHIIVPCDDFVLLQLRQVQGHLQSMPPSLMTDRETFDALISRERLMEIAEDVGVPCPPTEGVRNEADLRRWLDTHGGSVFLKVDQTFGGEGVRKANGSASAVAAFKSLVRPPTLLEAARRALGKQDASKLRAWFRRSPSRVTVQLAVPGAPANCSAFAWRGELKAIVGVESVHTLTEFGVATVVRATMNPAMEAAARSLAARLNLTGVFGLDFMVDNDSGRTSLLELNARPTPVSHMNFGPGRDLVAAMLAAISPATVVARPQMPVDVPIALFPHCLRPEARPESAVLDLPEDQPGLIRAFAPRRWLLAGSHALAARGPVAEAGSTPATA